MLIISLLIMAVVVAVDQLTKRAVLGAIGIGGTPVAVIDRFFYITCHRNSGAAWGLLKNGRVFFLILTPVLVAAMIFFMFRCADALPRIAVSFIIGGAVGNYIDRAAVGSVVDFLDFYIFGYNFPTFNAADSAIVFGAALMIAYLMFTEKGKAFMSPPADKKGPGAEAGEGENAGDGGGADDSR